MESLALRRSADRAETVSANRAWWDAEAEDYYAEHGAFLGDA
ncbi:MAG TPA: SAM-dependent methyltransferase, partial [Dermatophilaceae bacterium]|nr:SAM-dependent methyltransferase [Dermatophilaceae bacterium]